jgi:hypothetical protein
MPMRDEETLKLWTVYDHPKDYPNHYVARLSEIGPRGVVRREQVMVSGGILGIRAQLAAMGLMRMARQPDDDPVIVEVWL